MIIPFRIALVFISVLFIYFFGETLERFILDVIRYLIPLTESNAILFNGFHSAAYLAPVLFLGFIITASLGGEPQIKRKVWSIVLGVAIGIFAYRMYQVWWVLRGGGLGSGNEIESWTESLTTTQQYFLEILLPYILVGTLSGLITSLINKDYLYHHYSGAVSSSVAFLWLFATHKIQNLTGFLQYFISFVVVSGAGFAVGYLFRRIKLIENQPPSLDKSI